VRLFLDQMFRVELAERLRAFDHDVRRADEVGLSRSDDAAILAQAIFEQRILVTLDGHFGDWAILPLATHSGVIRVKANPTSTENVLQVLLPLLAGRAQAQFKNHLAIVSRGRVGWIRTGA
jgi:predicted nuclease of predicted toxin-antitoxin system